MMNTKVLAWVAIISIALNLLLAGFLLGKQMRPFPSFDPTRGYAYWVRSLPEARQEVLLPILKSTFRQGKPMQLRRLHREFRAALTAEPFDRETLTQALNDLRMGHMQRQQSSHAGFVTLVAELTPAERQALAEDLTRPPRRPEHRRP